LSLIANTSPRCLYGASVGVADGNGIGVAVLLDLNTSMVQLDTGKPFCVNVSVYVPAALGADHVNVHVNTPAATDTD
jgi:hypothetical protein